MSGRAWLARRGILAAALIVSLGTANGSAGVPQAVFDERVSVSRRSLRQACRASEQLLGHGLSDASFVDWKARKAAGEALQRWTVLARDFASVVPAGYSGDPAWGRRLEEVRRDLSRMKDEVEARDFRSAVLSCRRVTCALGEMHEANGVILTIDRVTELRRKTAYVRGLVLAGKATQVPPLIPGLLAARDTILAAPRPAGADRQAHLRLLRRLSRKADALAAATCGGDDLGPAIEELRVAVDELYDEAL